jgi:2-aminoadipate transaminase
MNWNHRFAQRTGLMKRNAVRELLKLVSRPDIISFAGGLPAAELFPVPRVQQALAAVLNRHGGHCLQYAETEGIPALREWIAHQFSRPDRPVLPANVLITSGAMQALDLIGRVLLNPGDEVLVENPTYLAVLTAWRPLGIRFLPVPSDADGLCVDALEPLLRRHPKLIYLVPNFQNPQGTTLVRERREKLVAALRDHDAILVEDNPYGDLRYDGSPLPHLFELEAVARPPLGLDTHVLYVGTFSKVLMPGLRVGWVIAPEEVIDKLVKAKQSADLHTSSLSQHLALELLNGGFLLDHLPVLRQVYRERRDTMLAALHHHFSDTATWTQPDGGMFLLATLPDHRNTSAILPRALEKGVAFVPGEEFHLDGAGCNTLRLNFSNAAPARIEEGIERLARACAETESHSTEGLPSSKSVVAAWSMKPKSSLEAGTRLQKDQQRALT